MAVISPSIYFQTSSLGLKDRKYLKHFSNPSCVAHCLPYSFTESSLRGWLDGKQGRNTFILFLSNEEAKLGVLLLTLAGMLIHYILTQI